MTTNILASGGRHPIRPMPVTPPAVRQVRLPDGWPLAAMLGLYPLWWLLGVSAFAPFLLAVPMAHQLWHRRPLRLPPGFGIWLVFLGWVLGSVVMLGQNPPDTLPATFGHRLATDALRLANYAGITVAFVYAGNLGGRVSQRRFLRWWSVLAVGTVVGGLIGMVAPHLEFTSPFEVLLPSHVRSNAYVSSLIHPAFAQVQNVFGSITPRPAAPFGYTNTWGNCLSVLLVWFVVSAVDASSRRRLIVGAVVAISLLPIIYSLNRGMWLGLIGLSAYCLIRSPIFRRRRPRYALLCGLLVATAVFFISPLHTTVEQRLHHGNSNDIRQFTTAQALTLSEHSPLIGFGTGRVIRGSAQSITVGRTSSCPRCGNAQAGENGELWSVLVSEGWPGVVFYLGFFVFGIVRFWRDRTTIGRAGVAVLMLAIGYSVVYNAVGMPLLLYLMSYAMLWRNADPSVPR